MNLIKQFPGITMKDREKFLMEYRTDQQKSTNATKKNMKLTKFYNDEFKSRHIKVIFIIVLSIAALYFIAFNIPRFF